METSRINSRPRSRRSPDPGYKGGSTTLIRSSRGTGTTPSTDPLRSNREIRNDRESQTTIASSSTTRMSEGSSNSARSATGPPGLADQRSCRIEPSNRSGLIDDDDRSVGLTGRVADREQLRLRGTFQDADREIRFGRDNPGIASPRAPIVRDDGEPRAVGRGGGGRPAFGRSAGAEKDGETASADAGTAGPRTRRGAAAIPHDSAPRRASASSTPAAIPAAR